MRGRVDSYLAAVFTGGIVRAVARGDGFAWFGFNWTSFLTSVVFGWLVISVSAAPLFVLSYLVADWLKSRNVLLYCAFAVASGSLWLWISIAMIGTEGGATRWETFDAALPAMFAAAMSAGLVQWLTSERTRSFPK